MQASLALEHTNKTLNLQTKQRKIVIHCKGKLYGSHKQNKRLSVLILFKILHDSSL